MKSHSTLCIIVLFLFSCGPTKQKEELINTKASIPETFDIAGKNLKVITTMLNRHDSTTSLLYGNEIAYRSAMQHLKKPSPGEKFTLVTWKQQSDKHWFGANIPGDLLAVEILEVGNNQQKTEIHYKKLLGKSLTPVTDTLGASNRVNFIISQEASLTP
ncbi:hypothetical protein QNI19_33760 [Cytophagaceae bacterium DM2B3-1]|uniref:Cytochrome P460 domain-containing protein n=1 Tax=Xanthocytophaga flava TaxID=3048013 RepID=A0ABT7CW40_9BACT|nr:hypothetical protein [Xanthocytophaga flavus]MDJ1497957.1 hypothetical protein [Xanthocytophaga flavus]